MIIKRRVDVENLIEKFEEFAEWDGTKSYLTINDTKQNGSITIMKYEEAQFTYYRKNDLFWYIREVEITTKELYKLIWNYRKSINEYFKVNKKATV